jgi:hypothetical protein
VRDADEDAKIESLTATVSDLENRLNDESAAVQSANAAAQAANAKADRAEADAQAMRSQLQGEIQTVPGEIQTAVDKSKPKPGWADNTKIGMTVFSDLSNIDQSPGPNKINGTGFDIKRAYVSIDHTFNSMWSANLTVDFAPNGIVLNGGTFGAGTLQGSEAIKYAYLQAKFNNAFIVQVGAAKMPWIPFDEDIYGYRFIDKVIIDHNKFGNSADWGVNAHGDLGNGLLDYSVSVVDGAGYKNPVRSQTMDVEGRVNINYHGFVGAIGGYAGSLSNNIQAIPPNAFQTANRFNALIAYTDPRIRAGFEYFEANNWKVTTKKTPDKAEGYSVFGSFMFMPMWSVFGRYDWENPSETLAPLERYTYYNIGINYEPVKVLDLALVYKHEDIDQAASGGYSDGTTTLAPTSTGKLHTSGAFDEFGLYTQVKF